MKITRGDTMKNTFWDDISSLLALTVGFIALAETVSLIGGLFQTVITIIQHIH